MSERVFVTGGTGSIGRRVVAALRARGDQVVCLTRDAGRARGRLAEGVEIVEGDGSLSGDWQQALSGCSAIVNLAGEPIAGKRWNAQVKQALRDSRVETTRYLVETVAALAPAARPKVMVSASGTDYYPFAETFAGDVDDEPFTEREPPGEHFLARMCRAWEREAFAARELGVRVVTMRTGVVLGPEGALDRMVTPFRFFVGGKLGSGRQWFSWIHLDDVVRAYLFAIDEPISGPVNLVAPESVRADELARTLGRVLGKPSWLPVPGFALRAAVGELAEYLLNGRRAVPAALDAAGFEFHHPALREAIEHRDAA